MFKFAIINYVINVDAVLCLQTERQKEHVTCIMTRAVISASRDTCVTDIKKVESRDFAFLAPKLFKES